MFYCCFSGNFTKQNNFINADEKWKKQAKIMNKLLTEEEKQEEIYCN